MPCQVFVDAKNEQDEFSCELFMIFLLSGFGHGYRLATKVAGLYAVHWFSRNRNNSSVRFRIAF
jgi:D-alanyl-lipoteichoic acid acyltransferase DltB (MBOAT superfamily)